MAVDAVFEAAEERELRAACVAKREGIVRHLPRLARDDLFEEWVREFVDAHLEHYRRARRTGSPDDEVDRERRD